MRLIKLGIANINTTVGATASNTAALIDAATAMARDDVAVACFPEQVIGGYPPEDLVQWRAFLEAQRSELQRFAEATSDSPLVSVVGLLVPIGGQIFNVAAVVHSGAVLGFVPKEKLPSYNVFYEGRTLSRGSPYLELDADGIFLGDTVFDFEFGRLAVEVCEDAWSPDGPMRRRCYSGAEIVVNVSASPFRIGINETRREMLATRSADNEATLVYANAVGAQDGLVYDGGGYVFQNGRLEHEAPRLQAGYSACTVDLDRTLRLRTENTTWRMDCEEFLEEHLPVPAIVSSHAVADGTRLVYPRPVSDSFFLPAAGDPARRSRASVLDELLEALALGVKDYFCKTGAFSCLGIALSGGRDSMLTLLVAWRAAEMIAAERDLESPVDLVQAFYMPSRYSTAGTRGAAATICDELGVDLRVIPIDEAFDRETEATREMLAGKEPTALTRQNIQARLRAQRMWNWANTSGALFLQTGDMSERAVGYTTIGGDLEGALSVIANIPKTVVTALLQRLAEARDLEGVRETLATAPGPELDAEQEAEAELMPFDVLDSCLWLYAGEKLAPDEMLHALPTLFPDVEVEQLRTWVKRFTTLFSRSIYKWVQAPLSLHVGSLDLDRERALQLPVVQSQEWQDD